MQWLYPAGAWALLALVPVILLWVLKKKARRQTVPSLLLWRRMESDAPQSKPFQRLKSRLLLWLQILTVLLVTLCLMRPATLGGSEGEAVLIVDLSASMQTQNSQGQSRLDEAKDQALTLLDRLGETTPVTVLAAGSSFQQLLSRSSDHGQARRVIQNLQAQNGGSDMEGALALARALRQDLQNLQIYVFTDDASLTLRDGSLRAAGESMPNRALLDATMQPESALAFARVQNYGPACEVTLECYADGELCDVRTASLDKDGQTGVRFAIPETAQQVRVHIAASDALDVDNDRYAVRPAQTRRTALLVTDGNVFLEKALALNANLTVDLASPQDVDQPGQYDLYVYDGVLPETLPESGAILAVHPQKAVLDITPGDAVSQPGALRAASGDTARTLCENLLLNDIAIRSATPLTGGTAVLEAGGQSLLAVQETAAHRAAVLGFDVHDSNLPLKADFPVLIQNLLAYLLPEPSARVESAACGESVAIDADVRSQKVTVLTPDGQTVPLNGGRLENTQAIGVYTLQEEMEDGTVRQTRFTLHAPAAESDTRTVPQPSEKEETVAAGYGYREWTLAAVLLLFVLCVLEWEVSRRGA